MLAALAVNRISVDREKNLEALLNLCSDAVSSGAELLLCPETALTGLIITDDPAHDLPLGVSIPGPATDKLANFCEMNGVWMATGLLEKKNGCLYDSAVLYSPDGTCMLHYRRINPQWHAENADPDRYGDGRNLKTADTPFGRVSFLICGDLFDDEVLRKLVSLKADLLLFPFARCFVDGSICQEAWNEEELPAYLDRIRKARVPALMTNYLGTDLPEDRSFGGAFAVSADGVLVDEYPLGREGFLMVDLDDVISGTR